ncbi:NAD(P)/FAD-dependent oxidoreductase [Sphingomonas sp. So64.6b]|uniref:flavin-containing monooxygenase n=1 Tax=Sphingomonas sp. So64.6b TaxID=2997354 RepID=UPI0015FF514C|nr:NAD(P)/FAD-dependent oxidoreductase [Sphingomonas sp. So64.6b]QNA86647.1 NAD(P)/FAD-dependent oxidoreductase [Sphingomonas sp. So64.6b]
MALPTAEELDFDPLALKQKYIAERDKRLRAEGSAQYRQVAGDFAHFVDDPHAPEGFSRPAREIDVEVAVIGGGFGGLIAAAKLREAGVETLCVIEKGADFGGTWYWNRYPGAACDVESYVYLPLLEELGYMPSEKYARGPEILDYAKSIARRHDLYDDALLQTQVTRADWDDDARRWIVSTDRGDRVRARFVVAANGPLNRPKLPGISGIENFRGHMFHTSRWDYAYTGGSPDGSLTGLADKAVGIIGTGATAIQCIPHLGRDAGELYVFQRTPSSIDYRGNRPTDPDWAASLKPGWHRERRDNFNLLVSGGQAEVDLVGDGWTDIMRNFSMMAVKAASSGGADQAALVQLADFRKMESIRARVDEHVADPAVAEALKPWYNQFCKRPCFHDDYLPTFNRPNVHLIDTGGRGVERITADGVVVGDTEHRLDCLIFATGFEVGTSHARRAGYEICGRDGATLSDRWESEMTTLHGFLTPDFPNLFVFSLDQSVVAVNFTHILTEQAEHVAYIIGRCRREGVAMVEANRDAAAAWARMVKDSARDPTYSRECTPGYYNNEGQTGGFTSRTFGQGPVAFYRLLADWREAGDMAGIDRTPIDWTL